MSRKDDAFYKEMCDLIDRGNWYGRKYEKIDNNLNVGWSKDYNSDRLPEASNNPKGKK